VAGICEGRVAIVTGAGRGIGREHALMLASEGAAVVVNDLGADPDGSGADAGPAHEVVEEIKGMGGQAVVNGANVADFAEAGAMVQQAIDSFGKLDILINNAGILRDRMIFSMSEEDWDAVIAVHLKGHFCPTRHAAAYWREQVKAGNPVSGRIINTASASGLFCNAGQSNYAAAKAGIASFTNVCALELGRLGVTSNCLAPVAMTRLVMPLMGGEDAVPEEIKESLSPRWIAAVATWLASEEAGHITGRTFEVRGEKVSVAEGWHAGPAGANSGVPTEVGQVLLGLVKEARPNAGLEGEDAPDRYTVA
jgi:NAD(P)-dependent dehydrogenase (short-subunit alcohol dehydrogenase family)